MELKDKKVIVTGGAAGMGKELVVQLLKKGSYVAALDINQEGLNNLKSELNNDRLSIHRVDVSNDQSLEDFKREYYSIHQEVDCLINCAGIIQPFVNVEQLDMNTINRVMNINFFGPFKLTKMFIEDLKKRPIANITNISSMGGFFPFPGQTVYGASKAALKLFTEGLYAESLDTNLKVMVVFPGAIATDIAKNSNVQMNTSASDSKMKMTSAPDASSQIIKGIEKDTFKLYVGKDAKFMNMLYKFNDKKAIAYINKMMKKMH
ncbi:MAG: SDR family oxidoreductase [Tenericutes bacterium]|jgi:short-subunit dehydrogenase|nr:SDR family oxidoreductase [Bacilli bacterium]NLV90116.1 SDR family oxidoreductase [Mycoplasmatota bacterium]